MTDQLRIRWAPKLRPDKLVRLYQSDAAGRLDDELLEEVAWTIYFRLCDVLRVSASRVVCPRCRTEFPVRWRGEAADVVSTCPTCAWTTTAERYHRSWEHQDLNGWCAEFVSYVDRFPAARTPQQRMLLVDGVVHALHRAAVEGGVGNFAARNFLEGNRPKIAALLDQLAYGPGSTVDAEARARWQATMDRYGADLHAPAHPDPLLHASSQNATNDKAIQEHHDQARHHDPHDTN